MKELGNTPADKNYQPSGISRAEEAAKKKYPIYLAKAVMSDGNTIDLDANETTRNVFKLGYEAAEKDLALTWEDIKTIVQIITTSDWYDFEISDKLWSQEFYEEVLKQFKEKKK